MAKVNREPTSELAEMQEDFDKALKRLDNRIKSTDQKLQTFKRLGNQLEQVIGKIERLANGKGSRG